MPNQSPNLSLPYIMPAQAQKHVTHNAAVERLDAIVQLTLVTNGAVVPPLSPSEGQAYGLGTAPTDAWAGQGGMIACWQGGGWMFLAPQDGWLAWVNDTGLLQVHDGGVWVTLAAADGFGDVGDLLHLTPRSEPTSAAAGDIYFDATSAKLRCHDGTLWHDLF